MKATAVLGQHHACARACGVMLGLLLFAGTPRPSTADTVDSVYLVSHGRHVGLVLEQDDRRLLGPFRYVEVGWGDGDFYPAARGTLPLALRAAFRSRWSVLQVVGFDDGVSETFPRSKILRVDLSPEARAALGRYVERFVVRDDRGRAIVVAPAEYGVGAFYLARGRYRLLDNSNTWVAGALRVAGCPVDVATAATAGALLHQAAHFAAVVRPGAFLHASTAPRQCA